ncbi:hypothetical protein T492DRAFT_901018, partial [Pavlovales sp. CCMP2436]
MTDSRMRRWHIAALAQLHCARAQRTRLTGRRSPPHRATAGSGVCAATCGACTRRFAELVTRHLSAALWRTASDLASRHNAAGGRDLALARDPGELSRLPPRPRPRARCPRNDRITPRSGDSRRPLLHARRGGDRCWAQGAFWCIRRGLLGEGVRLALPPSLAGGRTVPVGDDDDACSQRLHPLAATMPARRLRLVGLSHRHRLCAWRPDSRGSRPGLYDVSRHASIGPL